MQSVRLDGVTKRFSAVVAVDRASLQIAPGEVVTFLGPSGCGKTTTMRLIAGLERPDEGEIAVGDRVVSSARSAIFLPPERRDIGMVFQSYAIWPHMTVFENVAYPLKIRGVPRTELVQRVRETLELVELTGLEARFASELSGGQQQRVALARAIVFRPSLLLLDEPLSNLDAKLRAHMRVELRRLQQALGITTVYVTHDQAESMALSDRIVVMNHGRILQVGSPRELYERPINEFVADFIGSTNLIEARVAERSASGLIVRLPSGLEIAATAARQPTGDQVYLVIRPERLHIGRSAGTAPNGRVRLYGEVVVSVYYGDHREYRVYAEGRQLHVRAPADLELVSGERVSLDADPADFVLLPESSAPARREAAA